MMKNRHTSHLHHSGNPKKLCAKNWGQKPNTYFSSCHRGINDHLFSILSLGKLPDGAVNGGSPWNRWDMGGRGATGAIWG